RVEAGRGGDRRIERQRALIAREHGVQLDVLRGERALEALAVTHRELVEGAVAQQCKVRGRSQALRLVDAERLLYPQPRRAAWRRAMPLRRRAASCAAKARFARRTRVIAPRRSHSRALRRAVRAAFPPAAAPARG